MKSMKKTIAILVATSMLFGCVIGGTIAWLMDTSNTVTNTFTTSDITVTLTETRGGENHEFKMVPGYTIEKDPTVTVKGGSEDCYLFVKVEEANDLDDYIDYTVDSSDGKWKVLTTENNVYYREVTANSGDQTFAVLTDNKVTVKDTVTKEMMSAEDFEEPTLTFTAYAHQLYQSNTPASKFDPTVAWTNVKDNV
ncbi:MAG: hypothetical protein E7195_02790 [Peptococcaceae bacterium]|nr:hypothetical protein [Peptococcaceae bacterium]